MASPGNSNNPQTLLRPSSGLTLAPSSSYPPPTGPYPFHHAQYLPYPPPQPLPHQHQQDHQFFANLHRPNPYPPPPNPNPGGGARLMALLGTQNPSTPPDLPPHHFSPSPSAPPDFLFSPQPSGTTSAVPTGLLANMPAPGQPAPMRMMSSKLPKGRHLIGDHVVYDIDVRLQGEVQPQLEVTPITKYVSDPGLVLGRQIAVNRSYICYGLKMGNIRVLNINTALRSLLRGHTQRVTDMAFFAEDVHLLASASNDGRIFIWKINEGPDEEEKAQITGKVVLAIQVIGEEESVHPQLCWHPHKQEILMVAIGNRILKIDSTKIGKGGVFSAEEPMRCPLEKPVDGVQIVGEHEGVVTGLSMCQWMTTRLASASLDGTVKIWEDHRPVPLAVLRPHDGHPVNSVTFLTAPHRPDHIVLITGGTVNRELKIWTSAGKEGWLLPSDSEAWQCTQTLELKSSFTESKVEDVFFNQVVALPHAGLLLLANAKKNAIYAIHIDYGVNPTSTRMDYIAEFTVTMPILSVTGTSESLADGEHIVQVYCVQTQAIQQYALALSQCLPPPLENTELEKSESNVSAMVDGPSNNDGSMMLSNSSGAAAAVAQLWPSTQTVVTSLPESTGSGVKNELGILPSPRSFENIHSASPLSMSPRLSRMPSGFRSPSSNYEPVPPIDHTGDPAVVDYLVDRRMDIVNENIPKGDASKKNDKLDLPSVSGPAIFKHPTHLVTPSEILSRAPSSESQISQGANLGEMKVQDVVVVTSSAESAEVEVKVVGESGTSQNKECEYKRESHIPIDRKEKSFYSQASNLSIPMARDSSDDIYGGEGTHISANDVGVSEAPDQSPTNSETVQDLNNHDPEKAGGLDSLGIPQGQTTNTKGKKEKGKGSQVGPSSPTSSPFNSTDSSNGLESSSNAPSTDSAVSHLLAMQEMLDKVAVMQKEMQKQMTAIVSAPVNKEGKRLEASLGRNMEKVIKANTDALWARLQEENAKHEKLERDRTQQITNLITNCTNKDLPAIMEKIIKKEMAEVGQAVIRAVTPILEKCISSAITESFQKGIGDKAVIQLEKAVNSKLEGTVTRQIQAQFQTFGKQALQDSLRSSLEASIIPAFEMQCKAMFEQIDGTLQNGLIKHLTTAQQQYDSTNSPLAIALRDAINSASSMTQTLSGELAEGQRKLMAIAAAGAGSSTANPLVNQLSNGPSAGLHEMPEVKIDPTKELSRLVSEQRYEEAFAAALHRSDVAIVSWLCFQVDLRRVLALVPMPLSQGVLLALLQQLACDISNDTSIKVAWMTDVAIAINPGDPTIAVHVRPFFDQVYKILDHHRNLPTVSASEANNIRLLMHVINSVLMSCK